MDNTSDADDDSVVAFDSTDEASDEEVASVVLQFLDHVFQVVCQVDFYHSRSRVIKSHDQTVVSLAKNRRK